MAVGSDTSEPRRLTGVSGERELVNRIAGGQYGNPRAGEHDPFVGAGDSDWGDRGGTAELGDRPLVIIRLIPRDVGAGLFSGFSRDGLCAVERALSSRRKLLAGLRDAGYR